VEASGVNTVFRTDDFPPAERLDRWHELTAQLFVPVENRVEREADLRVEMHVASLGAVSVFSADTTPFESRRTTKLIRRSDPELFVVVLGQHGVLRVVQSQREADLGPGALTVVDTSRPSRAWIGADNEPAKLVALAFPYELLPVPADSVRRLLAVCLPGHDVLSGLVGRFVADLAGQSVNCRPAAASHLASATLDLLAALLAEALDDRTALDAESRRRALMLQVHAFIQQHLGDAVLSPDLIAAAHHVSTRTLHKLFQEQGATVAGWIRDRRLERCRRDLADPALATWSISAIAKRWALGSGAHFSRAFKTAYGLSPREYRQIHQELWQPAEGRRGSLRAVR
jgi:AraC-like DNA-binding protein